MKNHAENDNMKADWDRLIKTINQLELSHKQKKSLISNNSLIISAAAVVIILLGSALIWITQKDTVRIHEIHSVPMAHILPDGSEVLLKQGSKIKYVKNFKSGIRSVELNGEAYFNVKSNPNDPFYVKTKEAKVMVTGTSFLLSAYKNHEETSVLVDAGKVLFYNSETLSDKAFRVGLGPGDKGIYNAKLKQLNKTQNKNFNHLSSKP